MIEFLHLLTRDPPTFVAIFLFTALVMLAFLKFVELLSRGWDK